MSPLEKLQFKYYKGWSVLPLITELSPWHSEMSLPSRKVQCDLHTVPYLKN